MTGLERVQGVLCGVDVDRPPVLPILHSGLASVFGVRLGDFYSDAKVMADVMVHGCRRFGFDGVHISSGVTGEAEALGARTEQPSDGGPVLKEQLLSAPSFLSELKRRDPTTGGRMPLFFEATCQIVNEIGASAFVLANLRGPFLMASQLRGVQQILIDSVDCPDFLCEVLDFTTRVALRLGEWLRASGAHGLTLGEATCSPNFISPTMYREYVLPRHRDLIRGLKDQGWTCVGLHICGNTIPIIEDVVSTGADFMDIDYEVPTDAALAAAGDRMVLRGNLDPSSLFRFGTPETVRTETGNLRRAVTGRRWILSSGCDIPPGTPAANIAAFAEAAT